MVYPGFFLPIFLFSLFIKLIFWQIVVASIVLFILWLILQKNLVHAALVQFDYWDGKPRDPALAEIVVTSHQELKETLKAKIIKLTQRKFGEKMAVVFRVDRKIMGGLVIRAGEKVIDFALKERLRQALGRR